MSEQDPKVKRSPPRGAEAPSKIENAVAKNERPSVAIQHIPISRIKANPSNPRVMRDDRFAKLKRSITEFPDMLNKRPIVAVTDKDGKLLETLLPEIASGKRPATPQDERFASFEPSCDVADIYRPDLLMLTQ